MGLEIGFLSFSNVCFLYFDFKEIVVASKQGGELAAKDLTKIIVLRG